MAELLPCPFCGEISYAERKPLWKEYGGSTRGYYGCFEYDIRCHKCGCNIPLSGNDTIAKTKKQNKTQLTSGTHAHQKKEMRRSE